MLIAADKFADIFLQGLPLLDVRAEVEFDKGAFPGAVNIPILDTFEREQIGIIYKQSGSQAAVTAGFEMISGEKKQRRIAAWCEFINDHPGTCLYCFRGGQRSTIAQQWISERGLDVARIDGGYKAMRRFLIDGVANWCANFDVYIVGGKTGTGKTGFLQHFQPHLDLEKLANHRGSAFGGRILPQPSQIDFENALAIELLKLHHRSVRTLVLEDESKLIGRLKIPAPLHQRMVLGQIVVIADQFENRVERIYQEYVVDQHEEFLVRDKNAGMAEQHFAEYLLGSLARITKRLGGSRYEHARKLMELALAGNADQQQAHREWIAYLLEHYYDPMYDYQLSKKADRVVFTGTAADATAWLSKQLAGA